MEKLFASIRQGRLDELLKRGADIRALEPPDKDGLPNAAAVLRNLAEDRELLDGLDGLHGLDPDSSAFQPCTMKYRGREQRIQPSLTVKDYRRKYAIKWRALEPVLRAYYGKALPV